MLVHIYGVARKPEAPRFVFLHGYPGVRSKQNRDVAEVLAERFRREAHVLLYSGLTQAPGEFSFRNCMDDVRSYLDSILTHEANPIDLVGHSWGGFLALNVISEYRKFIRRVALMSPLLQFPPPSPTIDDRLRRYFEEMAKENSALRLGNTEDRLKEFIEVGQAHPTDELIAKIPEEIPVLFLQAEKDDVTPTSVARAKQNLFKGPIQFELVATDHSFLTGRDDLARRLVEFFA